MCGQLNHASLKPCRKCKCGRHQLQCYHDHYERKSQRELSAVFCENLPKLLICGQKTKARDQLKEHACQAVWPVWLNIPEAYLFDFCTHSVACLMHNEELGLMLQELEYFWKLFTNIQQLMIVKNMQDLPHIPGLPSFKGSLFDHMDCLLAKEVITLSKRILHATHQICFDDINLIDNWRCLEKHIKYCNMLAQPSLLRQHVDAIHILILDHHDLYKNL